MSDDAKTVWNILEVLLPIIFFQLDFFWVTFWAVGLFLGQGLACWVSSCVLQFCFVLFFFFWGGGADSRLDGYLLFLPTGWALIRG